MLSSRPETKLSFSSHIFALPCSCSVKRPMARPCSPFDDAAVKWRVRYAGSATSHSHTITLERGLPCERDSVDLE